VATRAGVATKAGVAMKPGCGHKGEYGRQGEVMAVMAIGASDEGWTGGNKGRKLSK
jgi:hypothetical protein